MHKLLNIAVLLVLLTAASAFASAQGGVKGKVRARNGSSIPNTTVTARQEGKDIKSTRSNSKGEFVLSGLQAGVYSLVFDADGFQSGLYQGLEIKNGDTRNLGDRLILMPDQGSQVIINGSVFYKEGTSLGGAKVEIERINPDGSTKKITTVYTNISGEFTLRQPEGATKYRITAKYKGAEGTKEIGTPNAAMYRLAITLDISRTEK